MRSTKIHLNRDKPELCQGKFVVSQMLFGGCKWVQICISYRSSQRSQMKLSGLARETHTLHPHCSKWGSLPPFFFQQSKKSNHLTFFNFLFPVRLGSVVSSTNILLLHLNRTATHRPPPLLQVGVPPSFLSFSNGHRNPIIWHFFTFSHDSICIAETLS